MKKSKILILIPILIFFIIPSFANLFQLQLLISCFIFAIVCESWDLSMGYLGLFNFGHLAFFAIGGYVSGILSLYYGLSPWLTLIISSLFTLILGLLFSLATLRASGFAFSLISFSFQSMLMHWIRSGGGPAPGKWGKGAYTLTGGTLGLGSKTQIPPFTLGSIEISCGIDKIPAYYFTLAFFLISTYLMFKLVNSRFGLAAMALRDSERYSLGLGINPLSYTAIFISVSTFFAGLAGSIYVHTMGVVGPELIGWSNLVIMCCIVEFGGLGTLLGPAAASFLLIILTAYLAGFSAYKIIFISLLMLFTLLIWPTGLAGVSSWIKKRLLNKTSLKEV